MYDVYFILNNLYWAVLEVKRYTITRLVVVARPV